MAYEYKIEITQSKSSSANDNTNLEEKKITSSIATNGMAPTQVAQDSKKSVVASVGTSLLLSQAKGYGQLAISNIGQYTGNSQLQKNIENGVSVASDVIGLGIGLATQNYALVIAQVANKALSVASSALQESLRRRDESIRLTTSRTKSGYDSQEEIIYGRRH